MQKILIVFCIVAASLVRTQKDPNTNLEERVFNQWLKKHNINVPNDADLNKWKANVIKKFKEMEAHNEKYRKGEQKFKKALNHLSHLSDEETTALLNGWKKPDNVNKEWAPLVDKSLMKDLPDYWDWTDKGVIQPALYQGADCNDCYVMGSVAAMEAHACIYNNMCEKLSEQDVVECTPSKCGPGYPWDVFNFTLQSGGLVLNKDYPYDGWTIKPSNLNACDAKSRSRVKGTKIISWKSLPNDADTMRYTLQKIGPLYVGFQAYSNLKDYHSGIYDKVEGTAGGHGVLLVGYGTDSNGTDYWIAKNSWSQDYWGEKGFFKILRGVNLADFEGGWATYPIIDTSLTS